MRLYAQCGVLAPSTPILPGVTTAKNTLLHASPALLALGASIGLVMGGTQALSRSMYSQLVPKGRESEYFSFYQAMERGTSWLGTLSFALVFQFSHSYRLAILTLVLFFLVGGLLLTRVDMRKGIIEAGNALPKVL